VHKKQYGFELNFDGAFLGLSSTTHSAASAASSVHGDRRSLGPYTLGLTVMVLSIGKRACSQGFTLKARGCPDVREFRANKPAIFVKGEAKKHMSDLTKNPHRHLM
jgi:hypothetical protein